MHCFRILLSCLRLIENHALLSGQLDDATLSLFSQIIARFVVAWQQAEEEKKRKQLEKESLYK